MDRFALMAVIVVSLAVVGCVHMPPNTAYIEEKNPPLITADANSAAVYFLRTEESKWIVKTPGLIIVEDIKRIGVLVPGYYFIHKTTPGKHTYYMEENKIGLTLNMDAGQTYYIEIGTGYVDFWSTNIQLGITEITKTVAEQRLSGLKYILLSTPDEATAIKAKERSSSSE